VKKKLRPYQIEALRYARSTDTPALFMEMRLGKTLVTVRRINAYPSHVKKVLVVGPYSVLFGWQEEIGSANCILVSGTGEERRELLPEFFASDTKYYLINKEGFLNLTELANYDWDCVVLDESTFIKTPWKRNKKTGKYSPQVTHYYCTKFSHVRYKWVLTGTPKVNSEMDYFCQLFFLNPNILGFKNFWEFRNKCFMEAANNQYYIKRKYKEKLYKILAKECFFLKRKDVGLGGEKIYRTRLVRPKKGFRKVYNKIEEEFALEYEEISKTTIWSMEKFLWLRRICGGFIEGSHEFDHKEQELLNLLDSELKDEQVIIWCMFVDEIERLHKLLPSSVPVYGKIKPAEREQSRKDFMNKKVKYFIGQPTCFKYGTDLSISDTMIYYSTPYSETRAQSEDRFVRIGKDSSLLVIDLVTEKTIEESILQGIRKNEVESDIAHRIITTIQGSLEKYERVR